MATDEPLLHLITCPCIWKTILEFSKVEAGRVEAGRICRKRARVYHNLTFGATWNLWSRVEMEVMRASLQALGSFISITYLHYLPLL